MKQLIVGLILLFTCIVSVGAQAKILMHESFEKQRGDHVNDIGYYSALRPRNNSCSSIDFGTCGNTCGNSNEDRCCRTGYQDAETTGSVIEDWSTARFNGGNQWTLDNIDYTVPQPVDGDWVYRAYVPDCKLSSAYRCNDTSPPVRLRALIASTSEDIINSASKSRWYGLAVWIDPAWNFDGWEQYENQTIMSQHLPNNYNVGGGGPVRIVFQKGWNDRLEWQVLSAAEATNASAALAAGCDSAPKLKNGYGCTDRAMTILNIDGSSSGKGTFSFDKSTDTGNWIYWVIHIKSDPTGTGKGILQVWMKRTGQESYHKLVDYSGVVGVMSGTAPYFKFGISDKATYGACPEIIYYDNFKVGDENSGFADVDPSLGDSKDIDSTVSSPGGFQLEN